MPEPLTDNALFTRNTARPMAPLSASQRTSRRTGTGNYPMSWTPGGGLTLDPRLMLPPPQPTQQQQDAHALAMARLAKMGTPGKAGGLSVTDRINALRLATGTNLITGAKTVDKALYQKATGEEYEPSGTSATPGGAMHATPGQPPMGPPLSSPRAHAPADPYAAFPERFDMPLGQDGVARMVKVQRKDGAWGYAKANGEHIGADSANLADNGEFYPITHTGILSIEHNGRHYTADVERGINGGRTAETRSDLNAAPAASPAPAAPITQEMIDRGHAYRQYAERNRSVQGDLPIPDPASQNPANYVAVVGQTVYAPNGQATALQGIAQTDRAIAASAARMPQLQQNATEAARQAAQARNQAVQAGQYADTLNAHVNSPAFRQGMAQRSAGLYQDQFTRMMGAAGSPQMAPATPAPRIAPAPPQATAAAPVAPAPAPRPATPPEGTRHVSASGKPIVWRNGRWEYDATPGATLPQQLNNGLAADMLRPLPGYQPKYPAPLPAAPQKAIPFSHGFPGY